MKLIQDWSNQDKTKLLDRILEVLGDKEYVDIVVYGSRVSGDFTAKSDIDVKKCYFKAKKYYNENIKKFN